MPAKFFLPRKVFAGLRFLNVSMACTATATKARTLLPWAGWNPEGGCWVKHRIRSIKLFRPYAVPREETSSVGMQKKCRPLNVRTGFATSSRNYYKVSIRLTPSAVITSSANVYFVIIHRGCSGTGPNANIYFRYPLGSFLPFVGHTVRISSYLWFFFYWATTLRVPPSSTHHAPTFTTIFEIGPTYSSPLQACHPMTGATGGRRAWLRHCHAVEECQWWVKNSTGVSCVFY